MSADRKNRDREAASRMAHLRSEVFATVGFRSNEPVPSPAAARTMARQNLRLIAAQRPQPGVHG